MSKTVKVGCRLPQGVRLRVSEWGKDGFGDPQLREVGMIDVAGSGQPGGANAFLPGDEGVAYSEVPAGLWAKWAADNKGSDLLTTGAVFEEGKDPLAKAEKAETDAAEAEKPATRRRPS